LTATILAHRRPSSNTQHADHLDVAVGGLGCPAGLSRQDRPGGVLRVDDVVLAATAPVSTIGSVDLDHDDPLSAQPT
jgi:hypothetical protein